MIRKQLLACVIGCSIGLFGCNDSNSPKSSSTATSAKKNENVTVTAMDGYLIGAKVYKQDSDGNCLVSEASLGKTDDKGKVSVKLSDLANGYCVVADTQTKDMDDNGKFLTAGYTLYSPKPSLLGTENAPVISPLTTYLHRALKDETGSKTKQEIIETAKKELAKALQLDGDSDEITALLATDYIDAKKTASDDNTKKAAKNLHTMAQLLADMEMSEKLTKKVTINIAKATHSEFDNIIGDNQHLDKIVAILSSDEHFEKFTAENTDEMKKVITDNINKALPKRLSVSSATLSKQLEQKIAQSINNSSSDLEIDNITISGINGENSSDKVKYKLTQKIKGSAPLPLEIKNISFENNTLTIPKLKYVQNGDYAYRLYIEKDIEGKKYTSNAIEFDVTITKKQVANSGPTFDANSETAKMLIEALAKQAENSDSFTPEQDYTDFGLGIIPASFNFDLRNRPLSPMFLDDSDSNVEVKLHANPIDFANIKEGDMPALTKRDLPGYYNISIGTLPIPKNRVKKYRVTLYAVDSKGAVSENGLTFILTIDSVGGINKAEITSHNADEQSATTGVKIKAVMLTDSDIANIASFAKIYLNGNTTDNVSLDSLFSVYEYLCDQENKCQQSKNLFKSFIVSDTSSDAYLKIDDSGGDNTFKFNRNKVDSEKETVLSISSAGEPVRIYRVMNKSSVKVQDINDYYNGVKLVMSPATDGGQATVAATFEK